MAEWLYEEGIGEARAALVDDGVLLEALIDWNDTPWRVGAITDARMGDFDRVRRRGFVILPDGMAAILSPAPALPPTQGASCRIEIVREPMRERRRGKWPKARFADEGAVPCPGPDLLARIEASGVPVRRLGPHGTDLLEAAGWGEMLEEAMLGEVGFPGGMLHLSITPAMTLIDVDGQLPPEELAMAGAKASAAAIRRLGLGGSIGIDLPTLESKTARTAIGAAFDALLPQPFERTAINGYGFMQIVRRRDRRSIPELLAGDPDGAAARALLRRAMRAGGRGALIVEASPAVISRMEGAWADALAIQSGRELRLRPSPARGRWEGHVDAEYP